MTNDNDRSKDTRKPPAEGHHDPDRSSGAGAGLAGRTPKGGASQDSFGQSGGQDPASQTDHNARPGR